MGAFIFLLLWLVITWTGCVYIVPYLHKRAIRNLFEKAKKNGFEEAFSKRVEEINDHYARSLEFGNRIDANSYMSMVFNAFNEEEKQLPTPTLTAYAPLL